MDNGGEGAGSRCWGPTALCHATERCCMGRRLWVQHHTVKVADRRPARILSGGLLSVVMTEEENQRERRRRGYWLRLARLQADLNQNEVARRLGMSDRSGTTVLAWEQGRRDPRATVLRQLAAIYNVPSSLFIDPPRTDQERLEEIVRLAGVERPDTTG